MHPTAGAFWGMGVGIGCGIGWGPGFGPEVVGYVGAGCGVGFSVGITLAGFGIGLPANCLFEIPNNALMATRSNALDLARFGGHLSMRNFGGDGWNNIAPCISRLQREVCGSFSRFKRKHVLDDRIYDQRDTFVPAHKRSVFDWIGVCHSRFFRPG